MPQLPTYKNSCISCECFETTPNKGLASCRKETENQGCKQNHLHPPPPPPPPPPPLPPHRDDDDGDQVRRMFTRADKDGSGTLTKEEWHHVLNSSGCKTSM